MGLFDDMLKSDESVFKNIDALNYEYVPKLIPFREVQQKHIAYCIKPLFSSQSGRNLFIYGRAGVGKTLACRHVRKELEEKTEDIVPLYINCWSMNTSFKIINHICGELEYMFTQNKRSDELFTIASQILNKKSAVFVFDEIDKIDDYDFLYNLLEGIYRKTIILITNNKDWLAELDGRIKSRLMPDSLEFKPYNEKETKEILRQRRDYAFIPNCWDEEAFNIIAKKTFELADIRSGLYLMKEAGTTAEEKSSRRIRLEHANKAINKLDEYSIKSSNDLEEDTRFILGLIKKNANLKIGDLFKLYENSGGKASYKTFQRRIESLETGNFINVTKTEGGKEGNTSIISYKKEEARKLDEF